MRCIVVVDVCWLAAWLTVGQHTSTRTHTRIRAHTHSNLCIKISHCALLVEHFWLFWFSLPLAIRSFLLLLRLLLLLICCCACAVHLGCRCCCFCCCRLPHAAGNKMAPCPAPDMCPQAKSLQHIPAVLPPPSPLPHLIPTHVACPCRWHRGAFAYLVVEKAAFNLAKI